MLEIEPSIAARLANGAYTAQSERTLEVFLEDPVFCQIKGGAQHLKAEVGFRIINAKDGFGVCVRGGKGREKETFIMFRGTTLSNYGADLISDVRIGVEKSKSGLPVHIGFNHAFCSMLPSIREFLNKNADATGTIHVIGHSLGGAVAALAADWLSTQRRPVKLYTFGAPKLGIDLSVEASGWVLKLMGKIMQALGMKVVKEISELTRQFMRNILVRLIGRMSAEAIRAIRGLVQNS